MIITIPDEIPEGDSYFLGFSVKDHETGNPINPTEVKVYIFLSDGEETDLTFINGRDGTNNDGLLLNGNSVKFTMSPADNAIVSSPPYISSFESHYVRFNVKYNDGLDNLTVEYFLKIRNLRGRS